MQHLKQLRIAAKLTQLEVSQLLGIDRSTYVKYERGSSDPSTTMLCRLADLFGVSVDELLGRSATLKASSLCPVTESRSFSVPESLTPLNGNISSFGLELKKQREAAVLSQRELGEKLGVSQATVGMWESGKREPNFSTLCRISDFFNISPVVLLGLRSTHSIPPSIRGCRMNRIREVRKRCGIKQTDLCLKLGVSQGALSGWENEKYDPGRIGWLGLADALNVSVDYLMGRNVPPQVSRSFQADTLTDAESRLLSAFSSLNEEGQAKVFAYIEDLQRAGIYKRDHPAGVVSKQA